MIILHIANFFLLKPMGLHALINVSQRISLGLEQNGHRVVEFSDKDLTKALSPLGIFKGVGRIKMADRLLSLARHVQPDQIWIGMGDLISPDLLSALKSALPDRPIILYNGDQRPGPFAHVQAKAPLLDWIFFTSGGESLTWYTRAGCPHAAFFPNMTDPAIDYPHGTGHAADNAAAHTKDHSRASAWQSQVLFAGGLHGEPERRALIEYLAEKAPITLYHCLGNPTLSGRDYFRALSHTRIGINISAYPQREKYLSDRPVHLMGCGALLLTRTVPGIEKLFIPDAEIITFETPEECLTKITHYLEHEEQRQSIALAGQKALRERFNTRSIVGDMLALIASDGTKGCDRPWSEVHHGRSA